jgi:adenylate cyclase, class 2
MIYTALVAAPREVEIKFIVASPRTLQAKLARAGFRCVTPSTHEINTLYDLPEHTLRAKGELLRLRQYGKTWILTHKARSAVGRHKSRIEHETILGNGNAMHSVLIALGYEVVFIYEKFRSEWSDGRGHVVLDRTPIGNVAEIEGSPRWIDHTARQLGVTPADYITQSYAELFFEWKRKYKRKAKNMTFRECGGSAKAAGNTLKNSAEAETGSGDRPRRALNRSRWLD